MFRDISAQAYILVLQTDVKYRDKNFVLCLLFVPNLQIQWDSNLKEIITQRILQKIQNFLHLFIFFLLSL